MIEGQEQSHGATMVIKAKVPLAEMFGYVTSLRSMTQGRASSTMEPSHYAEVPRNVVRRIDREGRRQGSGSPAVSIT